MTWLSFGDLHVLGQAVAVSLRRGDRRVLARKIWLMREQRRRGTWRPFTFRDYLALRRLRRENRRNLT